MHLSLEARDERAYLGVCRKLILTGILSVMKGVEQGPKMKLKGKAGVISYRVLCAWLGNTLSILKAMKKIVNMAPSDFILGR